MFYAHALRDWAWLRAHMNVRTITRFVQNYTVGVSLHCVASTMHVAILWPYSQALFTALQCYTLKTLLLSVLHCKASWEYYYIEYRGCTSVAIPCTVFWTIFFSCLVCR